MSISNSKLTEGCSDGFVRLPEKASRPVIFSPGARCAMEIRDLQRTTHLSIPKRAMGRFIKETKNTVRPGLRLRTKRMRHYITPRKLT